MAMTDRNFKLRQMYADYLDQRRDDKLVKKTDGPPMVDRFDGLSEEQKKKISVLKVEDEEAETLENIPSMRPILIKENPFELKKATKLFAPKDGDDKLPSLKLNLQMEEDEVDAKRLLETFNKLRIFESKSFRSDDIQYISSYFEDSREAPNDRLISILDYVFKQAILFIDGLEKEKQLEVVDEKILKLLKDQSKTKRLLMDSLLKYPDLMPEGWGKAKAIQRRAEAREMNSQRKKDDYKMILAEIEREKEHKEESSKKGGRSTKSKKEKEQKSSKSQKGKKRVEEEDVDKKDENKDEEDNGLERKESTVTMRSSRTSVMLRRTASLLFRKTGEKSENRSRKGKKEKEQKTDLGGSSLSRKKTRSALTKKKSIKDARSAKSKRSKK